MLSKLGQTVPRLYQLGKQATLLAELVQTVSAWKSGKPTRQEGTRPDKLHANVTSQIRAGDPATRRRHKGHRASLTLGCGVSAPVLLTASFVAPASGRVTGADL
ncbi:hypothetical protein PCASD_08450 [Puccinia coronata f. sp. avenae]|uniref:Uncharacterized protein n=1 Tax=Puccinia coronata f. sp. avenae TaxID=200324 RepID=A0A2N5UMK1_9BASI|nr:hypothetical protein PCASD_08450 [Puccinia coronata f. sp. avenae]